MNVDSKNEIFNYEGYKSNNISKDQREKWSNERDSFRIELVSNSTINYPIGRLPWYVHDDNCIEEQTKYLTLSLCEFGKQYTCDSGHCISIENRCDGHLDCLDRSDEKLCTNVRIPQTYQAKEPSPTSVDTKLSIEGIHHVNTIHMEVELTILISMKWYDRRLLLTNLKKGKKHLISDEISKKLWNPLEHLVHENALSGKIFFNKKEMYIETKASSTHMDIADAYEDKMFDGYSNSIVGKQRSRGSYACIFQLKKFPFDSQNCEFNVHIMPEKIFAKQFVNDSISIEYKGPKFANDFEVSRVDAVSDLRNKNHTFFMFSVTLKRDYSSQIISIFFPTWLIWFLAYFTFFIDTNNFNNRFMGSVTSLLVLSSLLQSMQNSLPKTTYFKYIDCWFLGYITNSIIMIAAHVLIDRMPLCKNRICDFKIDTPARNNMYDNASELHMWKKERLNNIMTVIFPILFIFFNLVYLCLHLS
jgi:hypothetical protein